MKLINQNNGNQPQINGIPFCNCYKCEAIEKEIRDLELQETLAMHAEEDKNLLLQDKEDESTASDFFDEEFIDVGCGSLLLRVA